MAQIPKFKESHLEIISNLLVNSTGGLSHRDLDNIFKRLNMFNPGAGNNKKTRLLESLIKSQSDYSCGNKVIELIQEVFDPAIHSLSIDLYEERRIELNRILIFIGYELKKDGKIRLVPHANTIDEANERINRFKHSLTARGAHPEIFKYCSSELIDENYFHAVFEATKSIGERIRNLTKLTTDGSELFEKAFGLGQTGIPYLALNLLTTETEKSEQKGFVNLLKGVFGTFRNPTGHAPKIVWKITEQDALDLLTMVSYIHRRLDTVHQTYLCNFN